MAAVISTNPAIDQLEKLQRILMGVSQARSNAVSNIISPEIASLIAGTRLEGVSEKQLIAFSKYVMKIQKMKTWTDDPVTIKQLDLRIQAEANKIVLIACRSESAIDKSLAEGITNVIAPREEYIAPEAELLEESVETPAPTSKSVPTPTSSGNGSGKVKK